MTSCRISGVTSYDSPSTVIVTGLEKSNISAESRMLKSPLTFPSVSMVTALFSRSKRAVMMPLFTVFGADSQ